MKKFAQLVEGGVAVPGRYVEVDASILDVLNPVVPLATTDALAVRAVLYALLGRIL